MPTIRKLDYFLGVAILVVVIAAATFLMANKVYSLWETMDWSGIIFFGSLIGLVLLFGCWSIGTIRFNYQQEKRITRIVGIHPSQLPEWKWRVVAKPIALKMLSEMAGALQSLDAEEKAYLARQDPDPQEVLAYNRDFKRKKEEFWELQNLFVKFIKVDIPKKSWSAYWAPPPY